MSSRPIRLLGDHLPLVWATLLALLLLGPALGPGYVLGYDLVWVPHLSLRGDFLGFGTALPRAVPSDAVVAVLDNVVPAALLEKLALLTPLVGAGAGMARLVGGSLAVRLTAVTLAVWNPFVVERLGIGHWTVLAGYGVLPWLVLAGRRLRRTGTLPAAAWVLMPLGALSASAGLVSALTLLVSGWRPGARRGRGDLALLACVVAGNAPWLVAGLLHAGTATGSATAVFALHPEGSLPAPLAALGMGGIWNSDVVPGSRQTFVAWLALLLLLGLAAVGFRTWRRRPDGDVLRLGVLWAIGFALACLTWLLPGPTDWLAAHVAGGGLLRDGTRSLGLCLPVYAGLPAVGVGVLADRAGEADLGLRRAVAAAGALLPLLLLYDAAWGLVDTLRPADYPVAWAEVRAQARFGHGDLLVLPFSAYRAPTWNSGRTVLDPLARYLPPDALTADTLVVDGRTVPGEDPRGPRVESALRLATAPARTRALLALGVQYVATETDLRPRPPSLATEPVASSGALVVERLDGTAVARSPTLLARLATGAAWTAYLLSLLGGLAVAGIGRVRGARRGMRTGPPTHVG
ncbi:hypothetical protein [Nocardioides cynanchi]|uniref:hypothetical protein n=1 Tax=Nocardioides cynanchi TaxID=2558918 RepID=UPI0012469FAC|nr:hypothetical protein [Nocardioides cynanchi]